MPKIITAEHINETKYYQVPKSFFHNPLYMDMRNESKLAYALLRDLLELSIKNNWINENNEVYVKLSRKKLMNYLHIKGTEKYSKIMKELMDKELIVKRSMGLNRVDETYICIPEELSIVYNDEELLEYEEELNNKKEVLEEKSKKDTANTDESRTFENRTSKSSKIERPEVRKSNVKKFENRTHTKTNITKTNITTSTSKGEKSPLAILFEEKICSFEKTTKPKFDNLEKQYDPEFLKTIINYGAEVKAKSFKWFEQTVNSYISKNILSAGEVELDIKNFREENKAAKKRALEEKRKITSEKKMDKYIANKEIDDMINFKTYESLDLDGAVSLEELKTEIAPHMSELQFNTWIKSLNLYLTDDEIVIQCPNNFTKDIVENRYTGIIREVLNNNHLHFPVAFSIK